MQRNMSNINVRVIQTFLIYKVKKIIPPDNSTKFAKRSHRQKKNIYRLKQDIVLGPLQPITSAQEKKIVYNYLVVHRCIIELKKYHGKYIFLSPP